MHVDMQYYEQYLKRSIMTNQLITCKLINNSTLFVYKLKPGKATKLVKTRSI